MRSTEKRRVTLRAFEFFPKIASLLSKLPSLPGCAFHYPNSALTNAHIARDKSGAVFVKESVERLCRNAWPASGIVNLTIAFRELSLQPDELKTVVDKIIKYALLTPHWLGH